MRIGDAVREHGGRFSAKVIRRWAEKGWIEGAVKSPGGRWHIDPSGLQRCVDRFTPHKRRILRSVGYVRDVDKQTGVDSAT